MSSITAIEVSSDDPNYREIYVDGEHVARIDASTSALLNLQVGSEWAQQQTSAVAKHRESQDARVMAMDLISRRMWGSKELYMRLTDRGVQHQIAEHVVSTLIEDDWLDDSAYAQALIAEWTRKEPAGKHFLRDKLFAKHIDRTIAEDAIAIYELTNPPKEGAKSCLTSRIAKIDLTLDDKNRNKLINAVLRRGFNAEVVHEALNEVLSE